MGWPRARPGTRRQPRRPAPRSARTPRFPVQLVLPPGVRRAGGGRWAGDNPKRAGAGSFLRNSQRRIPARGCPLPLTKYGAERPPARRGAREGRQMRVLHRRPSWSLPHPFSIKLTWYSPKNTPALPWLEAAPGQVERGPLCLAQSPSSTWVPARGLKELNTLGGLSAWHIPHLSAQTLLR